MHFCTVTLPIFQCDIKQRGRGRRQGRRTAERTQPEAGAYLP